MNPFCRHARVPIPVFRSSAAKPAPGGYLGGRRPRPIFDARHTLDRQHEAEALRARSLHRQEGPHWDAYAGCDRAPFGWEKAR